MVKQNQHVVPHQGDWAVRGEGNSRVTSIHQIKTNAISNAIKIAKNNQGDVIIHRKDGVIQDRDSYGHDPYPPRDRKH